MGKVVGVTSSPRQLERTLLIVSVSGDVNLTLVVTPFRNDDIFDVVIPPREL